MAFAFRGTRSLTGIVGIAALWVSVVTLWVCAPVMAGDDAPRMVVIEARRVITATGEEFSPGTVVIEDGKVVLVGTRLEYPNSAEVIDARRETVMPGLTLSQTRFQLPGYQRRGSKGGEHAASEVFPSEIDFAALVKRGFLYAAFAPAGSGIPGQASLYRTTGAEGPELVERSAYVRVSFGNPSSEKTELQRTLGNAKKAIAAREKARSEWEKKQAEAKKKAEADNAAAAKADASKKSDAGAKSAEGKPPAKDPKAAAKPSAPNEFQPPKIDPNLAPFVDRLDGKKVPRMVFELRSASGFLQLKDVLDDYEEIDGSLVLSSGAYSDFPEVFDLWAESKPVTVLTPTLTRHPHTVNLFNLAKEVVETGCTLAFRPSSDSTNDFDRYLQQVGNLVREGLERDVAIAAVTLGPAQVVGIGDQVGSIEKDKRADLIFLSGDPFRADTKVTRAMVAGEIVWED